MLKAIVLIPNAANQLPTTGQESKSLFCFILDLEKKNKKFVFIPSSRSFKFNDFCLLILV